MPPEVRQVRACGAGELSIRFVLRRLRRNSSGTFSRCSVRVSSIPSRRLAAADGFSSSNDRGGYRVASVIQKCVRLRIRLPDFLRVNPLKYRPLSSVLRGIANVLKDTFESSASRNPLAISRRLPESMRSSRLALGGGRSFVGKAFEFWPPRCSSTQA